MNSSLSLLVMALTFLCPGMAHFWPPNYAFHSVPNEALEPTLFANVVPNLANQQPPTQNFLPNRHGKSDSLFMFRPLIMSAWNDMPEQRMRLHNPWMERLLSSPYRRSRFMGSNFKDGNVEEFGRRKRRVRGIKGEINVKWAVMPIFEKSDESTNKISGSQEDIFRRPSREFRFGPRVLARHFPVNNGNEPQQQPFTEAVTPSPVGGSPENDVNSLHRERRQIGTWNPQPLLNKLLFNATGMFDNLGRQMTRQFQTSVSDAGRTVNGVFQSMQENFKRFINLNLSQLRPEKLFSQIASLTKTQ